MSRSGTESLSFVRGGAASGEGILWIHGYTMSADIWKAHWRLMPDHRHLAVNLPGHGRAPVLRDGQTLAAWVDNLRTRVEDDGVSHLVAVSFGGLVALALAARLGPALRTLVLNSPAIPGAVADPAAQGCSLELVRQMASRGRGPWLTDTWLNWPHAIFDGMRDRPARWKDLRLTIESHEWRELEDGTINRMVIDQRCATLMKAVRARTLLVAGERDLVAFKRNTQVLIRGINGAHGVRIAGCGHLAVLEEPEMAIGLLSQHIGRESTS